MEAITVPASVLNAGTELVVHLKEGRRPGENGYVINNLGITYNLRGVRGDDWMFGVSACTDDGLCSPVASAVPAGGFVPISAEAD